MDMTDHSTPGPQGQLIQNFSLEAKSGGGKSRSFPSIVAEIKRAASGKWLPTLRHFGLPDSVQPGKNHTCPICRKGSKDSGPFRILANAKDGEHRPYCQSCGRKGGSIIDAVAWLLGKDATNKANRREVLEKLAAYFNIPIEKTSRSKKPVAKAKTKTNANPNDAPSQASTTTPPKQIADIDVRHAVYSAWVHATSVEGMRSVYVDPTNANESDLREQCLSAAHRQNLRDRGLSDEYIEARGFRSWPRIRKFQCEAAKTAKAAGDWRHCPGIEVLAESQEHDRILIPMMDFQGRVGGFQFRNCAPNTQKGQRYKWLSEGGYEGGKWPCHVPLAQLAGITAPYEVVRITEGPLKADVATCHSGVFTIGVAGTSSWRDAIAALKEIGCRRLLLSFDADAINNPQVARSLIEMYRYFVAEGYEVAVEEWQEQYAQDPKLKGIDDLLSAGKVPNVLTGDAAEAFLAKLSPGASIIATAKARSKVDLPDIDSECLNERTITDELAAALKRSIERRDISIYSCNKQLVEIVADESQMPQIAALKRPRLRELLSTVATFTKGGEHGEVAVPIPQKYVEMIESRPTIDGVPKLKGVVNFPVLRVDGTLLQHPGYDPQTCLYLHDDGAIFSAIPEQPTQRNAFESISVVREVIAQFPFRDARAEAAWFAGVLTIIARRAIDGPTPLFFVTAPVAGAGKTMLAKLASVICTGEEPANIPPTEDDDEIAKNLLPIAEEAPPAALIDNVKSESTFGSPALDSFLTSKTWAGRILGKSQRSPKYDVATCIWATGNNPDIVADTGRRYLPIQLSPLDESPEKRTGFAIKSPLAFAKQNRERLVAACATILRAWHVAGRPDADKWTWGSYESWASIIPPTVAFAGLGEFLSVRDESRKSTDRTLEWVQMAIDAVDQLAPNGAEVTAREIIDRIAETTRNGASTWLLDVIEPFRVGTTYSVDKLGKRLRSIRGRIFADRYLETNGRNSRGMLWKVVRVDTPKPNAVDVNVDHSHKNNKRNNTDGTRRTYATLPGPGGETSTASASTALGGPVFGPVFSQSEGIGSVEATA